MKEIHIFLAEDSEADVFLLTCALEEHGIQFILDVARDGDEALKFVAKIGDQQSCPDIAVVDLHLPRRNGIDILRKLRERGKCPAIPVILTTSSESAQDREAAEGYGAVFFSKPTNLEGFLKIGALVKSLCNLG